MTEWIVTAAKTTIAVFGVLLAVVTSLVVVAILTGFIGKSIRYEIVKPLDGWVTIIYSNSDCKPLEEDGLFLVVHVDVSGKGCSSSPMPRGWRYNKFVHVDKNGRQTELIHSSWASKQSRMIWAGAVMTPAGGYPHFAQIFFVGTADQLNEAWSRQPIPK